jgi:predicted dehydrogenase
MGGRPLRIGLVGCGAFGACHARAWTDVDGASLHAVFDPREDQARSIAIETGARVARSLEELVSAVDAIDVVTPPSRHAAVVRDSLRAGRHVLVEKPLGTCALEAGDLARLAAAAGRVLMVGYLERFHPAIARAIAALPQPRRIETMRVNQVPPKNVSAGIIHDLMCHDIELATRWISAPVAMVSAFARRDAAGVADEVTAELRFADGRTATLVASWRGQRRRRDIIACDDGERRCIDLLASNAGGDLLHSELSGFVEAIQRRSMAAVTADDAARTLSIVQRVVDACAGKEAPCG